MDNFVEKKKGVEALKLNHSSLKNLNSMGKYTLHLLATTYGREAISKLPLEGIDAVFATARTDFGGYSYAYSSFIFEHLGLEQSPCSIRELAYLGEVEPKQSTPYFILTPVVPNDAAASKALMLELLKLCEKRAFQKVLLTQFIELKSKQERARHQNFAGVLEALNEYSAVSDLKLTLCLDHRYIGYYQEEFLS